MLKFKFALSILFLIILTWAIQPYITHKPEIGWQGYALLMTGLIGLLLEKSSEFVSKERKIIRRVLRVTGFLLVLFGFGYSNSFKLE
jgi:hypothetical protein